MNYWTYMLCLGLLLRALYIRLLYAICQAHAARSARAWRGRERAQAVQGIMQMGPVVRIDATALDPRAATVQFLRTREARRA